MSDPILFLEEGFVSREAAEGVDSIFRSAHFEWTIYRIEDLPFNAKDAYGAVF